ncbi:MAG: hypothetical protein VX494_08655 [Actinomycetota bacterium]|nr:hypothetical protein [Actinomycetota bacterium]
MDHLSTRRARGRRVLVRGLVGALLVVVLAPGAAHAREDDKQKTKVGCRGDSTSDVKLKAVLDADQGIITVTGVVFSDDDDVWEWRMLHNGSVSAKGSVKAKDADRSFRIIRDMIDFSGTDEIGFRADNTVTGEVCRAALEI